MTTFPAWESAVKQRLMEGYSPRRVVLVNWEEVMKKSSGRAEKSMFVILCGRVFYKLILLEALKPKQA
jgi:hypothetical protein